MPTYTTLYGVTDFGDDTLNSILQSNVIEFLNWGLLDIGAFHNVSGVVDGLGINQSALSPMNTDGDASGTVWQSRNQNWVWESGLQSNPIAISGISIDSTFYPTATTGTYAHHYNYPLGQVVFDNPVPTSSVVSLNYSYKIVSIIDHTEVPFLRRIQSNREDNFSQIGQGEFSTGFTRIQPPVIAVEIPNNRKSAPFEIGNNKSYKRTQILFHILAFDAATVDKLIDIIDLQNGKTIMLFDNNLIASDDAFPLDYRGMVKDGAKTYPEMVEPVSDGGFRTTTFDNSRLRFIDSVPERVTNINDSLYYGTIKIVTETII